MRGIWRLSLHERCGEGPNGAGLRRRAPLMSTHYNLAQEILFASTRFEPAATRTDTGADFIGSILTDFDEKKSLCVTCCNDNRLRADEYWQYHCFGSTSDELDSNGDWPHKPKERSVEANL